MIYPSRISEKVARKLAHGSQTLRVTAAFERSIHIEFEDHFLIHLGSHEIPVTPRSILLAEADFGNRILPVTRINQSLRVVDGSIHWPEDKPIIFIPTARRFDPKFQWDGKLGAPADISNNLMRAFRQLPSGVKSPRGFAPSPLKNYFLAYISGFNGIRHEMNEDLTPNGPKRPPSLRIQEVLWKRIGMFLDSCRRQAWDDMSRSVLQIVGLGPGLTPSGDDFLAGLITAGIVLSQAWPKVKGIAEKMAETTLRESAGRTTAVSTAMLEDARQGEMSEPMKSFLEIILITGEMGRVPRVMEEILSIGASSGEDQLNGLATGIRFFQQLAFPAEVHFA
jgi:hypothetical protein